MRGTSSPDAHAVGKRFGLVGLLVVVRQSLFVHGEDPVCSVAVMRWTQPCEVHQPIDQSRQRADAPAKRLDVDVISTESLLGI
jgi:hypothetical protein